MHDGFGLPSPNAPTLQMFYNETETKLSPEQIGVFTEIAGCEASVSDLSMSEINLSHFTLTTTGHA